MTANYVRKYFEEAEGGGPLSQVRTSISESRVCFEHSVKYSEPTNEMFENPVWNAIWETIKTWDVGAPNAYRGYMGATGNHATAIFLAIQDALDKDLRAGEQILQQMQATQTDKYENAGK
jgi:hypothetical protein